MRLGHDQVSPSRPTRYRPRARPGADLLVHSGDNPPTRSGMTADCHAASPVCAAPPLRPISRRSVAGRRYWAAFPTEVLSAQSMLMNEAARPGASPPGDRHGDGHHGDELRYWLPSTVHTVFVTRSSWNETGWDKNRTRREDRTEKKWTASDKMNRSRQQRQIEMGGTGRRATD